MTSAFALKPENIVALKEPVVFKNMIDDWPAFQWTPRTIAAILGQQELAFRIGPKDWYEDGPLFETECQYEKTTVEMFCNWLESDTANDNPLSVFDPSHYWCYLDYKYMKDIFDKQEILQQVDWSSLGYEGRHGRESTLWLGSAGAHTPCHFDTYGYNLVGQIYGRKRWILFPPDDNRFLYPTRIPYEESSVFSKVNVMKPDFVKHANFRFCTPHVITLEPGDVLYVPRQWWHFVESLDTSISINSWIELPDDNIVRVEEAVARILMTALTPPEHVEDWFNPTEALPSQAVNYALLSEALVQSNVKKAKPTNTVEEVASKRFKLDRSDSKEIKISTENIVKVQKIKLEHYLENLPNYDCLGHSSEELTKPSSSKLVETDSSSKNISEEDFVNCVVDSEIMKIVSLKLFKLLDS